jgi:hypothetical protein
MGSARKVGVGAFVVAATLAALVTVSTSCASAPDGGEKTEARAEAMMPSACPFGMTPSAVEINPLAPRCKVGQLTTLLSYVCADPTDKVCTFLKNKVAGHGLLQCRPFTAPDGSLAWCADVVDKYPDGEIIKQGPGGDYNFLATYGYDPLASPQAAYWDSELGGPDSLPPVSLSVAGYLVGTTFSRTVPPNKWTMRVFLHDPHTCNECDLPE